MFNTFHFPYKVSATLRVTLPCENCGVGSEACICLHMCIKHLEKKVWPVICTGGEFWAALPSKAYKYIQWLLSLSSLSTHWSPVVRFHWDQSAACFLYTLKELNYTVVWHLSYGEWHHLLSKFNFDSKSAVKSAYPPSWLNNIIKAGRKHCTLDSEMSVRIIGFMRLRLDKVQIQSVWGICAGSSAVGFFTEPWPEQQDYIKEEQGILSWSGSSSGARAGRPLIAGFGSPVQVSKGPWTRDDIPSCIW